MTLFQPKEYIAGLSISSQSVNLVLLDRAFEGVSTEMDLLLKLEAKLDEGTVANGKVEDKEKLKSAIKNILAEAKKKVQNLSYVILSVPHNYVFSDIYEFPALSGKDLTEAVSLEAQNHLPVPPEKVYLDWQDREIAKELGTIIIGKAKEVFIASAAKEIIDAYREAVVEAGFINIAVESAIFSVSRLFKNFENSTGVIVYLNDDGVHTAVLEKDWLSFTYFTPWKNKEGALKLAENSVIKLINFYEGKLNKTVTQAVIIGPEDIKNSLIQNLKDKIEISKPVLKEELERVIFEAELDYSLAPALGAAFRGLIPRSEDTVISLLSVGTELLYSRRKFYNYVNVWANIISGFALVIILAYLGDFLFLSFLKRNIETQLQSVKNLPVAADLGPLEIRAKEFNQTAGEVIKAQKNTIVWSGILDAIFKIVPTGINLTRITFTAPGEPVKIDATSQSRDTAILFKKALEESQYFSNVDLPTSGLGLSSNIPIKVSMNIKEFPK